VAENSPFSFAHRPSTRKTQQYSDDQQAQECQSNNDGNTITLIHRAHLVPREKQSNV
jgi:hypothetical protein